MSFDEQPDGCENCATLTGALAAKTAELEEAKKERDLLRGGKFSDRDYNALKSRAESAEKALAEAVEADRLHALVCPTHVKNADPWVRESSLLAMTENRDHWKQSAEDHSESATKWHAALQSSREEVRVLREALGKMPCNCAAERYGSHATNCGKRILSPAPSAPSEVKP